MPLVAGRLELSATIHRHELCTTGPLDLQPPESPALHALRFPAACLRRAAASSLRSCSVIFQGGGAMRLEKCWFFSSTVYTGHGMASSSFTTTPRYIPWLLCLWYRYRNTYICIDIVRRIHGVLHVKNMLLSKRECHMKERSH